MLFLCTSSPQPRSITRSMTPSLGEGAAAGRSDLDHEFAHRAHSHNAGCRMLPRHVFVGLFVPLGFDVVRPRRARRISHFHPARVGDRHPWAFSWTLAEG